MRNRRRQWSESALAFLMPAVLVLLAVTLYPTLYGIWLSFMEMPVGEAGATNFIGFENYAKLIRQTDVRGSLITTLLFVAGSTGLSLVLGFAMALLLDRQFWGKSVYLGLFILPIVATPVASGMMFKLMLSTEFGVVNYVVRLLSMEPVPWLARGPTALLSVILVEVWKWSPFVMYLMLAALGALSKETEEAAIVDGANAWQVTWHIKFPQLLPAFVAVLLIRLIDAFKAFDHILTMTQGGPGRATQVLNLTAYLIGFRYFNLGKAAALGLLVLILVVICSQSVTRVLKQE